MSVKRDSSSLTSLIRRRTIAAYYCQPNPSGDSKTIIREGHLSSGGLTGYLEKYIISTVCLDEKTGSSTIQPGPPYPTTYTIFDGLGADNTAANLTLDDTEPTVITYDGGSG